MAYDPRGRTVAANSSWRQSTALESRAMHPPEAAAEALPDLLTLIGVSALAYVLATALHEHLGHALACVALGSHPLEMGAFYIECDDTRLGSVSLRLVSLAGPVVSLLTGLVCF